ncbi:spindle pole body component 110-like [Nicotiana sylvestris]|uniref:spindle pole body component 110-like n=1 Tax=Nicotiana sylvestris TaxID=4096 RepID=UPI00388C5C2C
MADAILWGRSPQVEGVGPGASSVHSVEGGASSNVGGPRVEDGGSGSDIDPEDVNEFVGHHTHVEVRMDGSDRHVVVLGNYNLLLISEQVASALAPLCAAPESEILGVMRDVDLSQKTLVLEVERERRERKRTGLYEKMSSKYQQYRAKHQAISDMYHQDPEFQVFHEGLKQREDQLERKIEELRERDEELVKDVARNSEIEASLKAKEDELELSRGVTAENADLQLKVADLTAELSAKVAEIEGLKGKLNVSANKLAAAISESVSLENTLRISKSELTREREASGRQVAWLEQRVNELEAELVALKGQMASLRAEEAS